LGKAENVTLSNALDCIEEDATGRLGVESIQPPCPGFPRGLSFPREPTAICCAGELIPRFSWNFSPIFKSPRRVPNNAPLALQLIVKPLGKLLVFRRIADEARVKPDGPSHQRADVGSEFVRTTAPAQKYLGNLAAIWAK